MASENTSLSTLFRAGDARLRYMGRWETTADAATTVNSGSSILVRFSGGSLIGVFQPVTAPAQIFVTIDNGPQRMVVVDREQIELASAGLSAGHHVAEIVVKDVSQEANRWKRPFQSAVIFMGVKLAAGGELLDPAPALIGRWAPTAPIVEFYGDSITQGVRAVGMPAGPEGSDGARSFAYLSGAALGANTTTVGFGGQGLLRGGGGEVPAVGSSFPYNFAGAPRNPALPSPQIVVINQGTNDGGAERAVFEPAYLAFLRQVRAAYPRALIAAMRPFNGAQQAAIQSAVRTMNDSRIVYIDTEDWLALENSPDYTEQPMGLHPSLAGHAKAAAKLTALLRPYLK